MKKFYIKERNNPQIKNPYYEAMGKLFKKEVKDWENTLYGRNVMIPFETRDEYEKYIKDLEDGGFSVRDREGTLKRG